MDTLNVTSFGGFVNINGGVADELNITSDRGFVDWSGGQFGDVYIEAVSNSVVTIFGSNFLVNGVPFGGGNVAPPSGELSGLLADGTPFSALFLRQFEPQNRVATIRLVMIPEPGTLVLTSLALASLMMAGRHPNTRS
jgi:hypothetical protein